MAKAKKATKATGSSVNTVTKALDAVLAKATEVPECEHLTRDDKGVRLQGFLDGGVASFKVTANAQTTTKRREYYDSGSPQHKDFLDQEYLVLLDDDSRPVLINRLGQCFLLFDFNGSMCEGSNYASFLEYMDEWSCSVPDAQLIPSLFDDCAFDCINNADEDMEYSNSRDREEPHGGEDKIMLKDQASLSFTCLGRFADGGGCKGAELLREGLVTVVDWTPDERKPISKADAKKLKSNKPATVASVKPPEAGFVANGGSWHRSGFALIKYDGAHLLFGVDDDAYFGCELPKKAKPKTIGEAVAALAPPALEGKICTRQGEWFFETVGADAVPKITESVAYCLPAPDINSDLEENGSDYDFCVEDCMICLPKKDAESNTHAVVCEEWRVGADGFIYACAPNVFHPEHSQTREDNWVRFHENTAIRSFSVAGVD